MRELSVDEVPVTVTLGTPPAVTKHARQRMLKLCRQHYYRRLHRPVSDAERIEVRRANVLFDAHKDDPEFGYRLLADEARLAGLPMADRTVWRICQANGWFSAISKKVRRAGRPGPAVHDDLLAFGDKYGVIRHRFIADRPNPVWLTDIPPQAGGAPTEHSTREGKLYLCAVKDANSGRIVGYSIDKRMKTRSAVDTLRAAVARRGPVPGCIVHSGRGSQFRTRKYVRELRFHDLGGAMGRVAAAGDNAAMESFFALLQNNVLNRQS